MASRRKRSGIPGRPSALVCLQAALLAWSLERPAESLGQEPSPGNVQPGGADRPVDAKALTTVNAIREIKHGEIRPARFQARRTGVLNADRSYLAQAQSAATLPEGPYVFLDVEDTGCGKDGATRSRMFEPFFDGVVARSSVVRR